jgi:ketosteroid isomerase-like protein
MTTSQTREDETVRKVLLGLETGAMERWRSGDPMGWAEISAADVTYVDPGLAKPVTGIQEYRSYLKQLEGKVFYQGSEFLDPQVVVEGDAAVLSYNYRSTGEQIEAGSPNQTLWNTTEVYFRRDGQWKIAHTHWSFVRHELPAALEMPVPVQMAPHDFEGNWARSWRSKGRRWSAGAREIRGVSSSCTHRTFRTLTPERRSASMVSRR